MKKKTARTKVVLHRVYSKKRGSLFSDNRDWFLFMASTVVICISVFYLFGLISF